VAELSNLIEVRDSHVTVRGARKQYVSNIWGKHCRRKRDETMDVRVRKARFMLSNEIIKLRENIFLSAERSNANDSIFAGLLPLSG